MNDPVTSFVNGVVLLIAIAVIGILIGYAKGDDKNGDTRRQESEDTTMYEAEGNDAA